MGEGARGGVNGVGNEGVRGYRGAIGDRVLEGFLVAGGEGQELVVGLGGTSMLALEQYNRARGCGIRRG